MAWAVVAVSAASAIATGISARKNRKSAEKLAGDAAQVQAAETAKLDAQKEEYKSIKFENPYENMENVYEDLTVNQQQADFQAQQGDQQRANIMQSLKGAAGGSGVAGLAQAMANQGQLQTQRISASIGQQEAQNQRLRAQGASQIQQLERGGDQSVQQAEMNRQSTLLGMQMGSSTAANQGLQAANLNEQQVAAQGNAAITSSIGNLAGDVIGSSDTIGNVGKEGYNWKGQEI